MSCCISGSACKAGGDVGGVGLHLRAACLRRNPYHYQACADPQQMLQCFLDASVEQQGQIWQDHVQALVQGQPLACMCLIAEHVHQAQAGNPGRAGPAKTRQPG
jgi:hypothetical protein